MIRRILFILLAAIAWFAACKGFPPKKWNLIFVTVDTLRADHTPFGSYKRQTMPNTANFFGRGTNFRRAETPRSFTVPAYASLLTGLYPYRSGVHSLSNALAEELTTLPEILRQHNYTTAGFVSSFALTTRYSHFGQGFDTYDDNNGFIGLDPSEDPSQEPASHTVPKILKFLKTVSSDKPFFLFLHFIEPHAPYDPPPPFKTAFHSGKQKFIDPGLIPPRPFIKGETNVYQYIDYYDGDILYLDNELRPLFSALQKFRDNSWFLFVADHGESLGEHELYFEHGHSVYESETHIPMVWMPPTKLDTKYAATSDTPASLVDIVPTALDALGIDTQMKFDGESLIVSMMRGGQENRVRLIEKSRAEPSKNAEFAAVNSKYKLIVSESKRELYDLTSDPLETRNLLDQTNVPGDLSAAIDDYRVQYLSYRPPFAVPVFPTEIRRHPEKRHVKNEKLTDEEKEKLKALGYVDE
jgi:arylsulfatase A-like enzyme